MDFTKFINALEKTDYLVEYDKDIMPNEIIVKLHSISAFKLIINYEHDKGSIGMMIYVGVNKFMFDGPDLTDINILISMIALLVLRLTFRSKVSMYLDPHPLLENEYIGSILLIRNSMCIEDDEEEGIKNIEFLMFYIYSVENIMSLYFSFGKDSNIKSNLHCNWEKDIKKLLELKNSDYNMYTRENPIYQTLFSQNRGIIHYQFEDKLKFYNKLIDKYNYETLDGVDSTILKYNFFHDEMFAVPLDAYNKIININNYFSRSFPIIVGIDNYVISINENSITAISTNCSEAYLDYEVSLIKRRQEIENEFLFKNSSFIWSDNIDDELFELMVFDLLHYEPEFWDIKKVGATREGDGNRDLQAVITIPEGRKYNYYKILIQCKAFKKTVGKSDIRDIRDTIEHYKANGYMVITSSRISVPLQDHLEQLKAKSGYYIEWWNRENIEIRLRKHPEILGRYSNIIRVKDITDF